MTEANMTFLDSPWFADYQVDGPNFDELGRGIIPAHWSTVLQHFSFATDLDNPESRRQDMLVRNLDVARPWRLDPIPFTLSSEEWLHIECGLVQRAELLNGVVADLYRNRTLLAPEGLPPALVFGNPRFLLPTHDYRAPRREFLQLLAFDLGRSPDGQWRVLADWTEAPQGLGICLENRIASAQAFPELFAGLNINRLADFFNAYATHLQKLGELCRPDGITVMLSSGPEHPGYFEHTYLGQYFGFPVVEGQDLTVRGSGVLLKTLEGLKPVNAINRLIPSSACDVLQLDPRSLDGVAGLTEIARQGLCLVANGLGTGVVENGAFTSFLPGLCQQLLGQELVLPSLASWWCGQADALDFVRNHHDELVLESAFAREASLNDSISRFASPDGKAWPLDRLDNEPHSVVGREPIALSHSPYLATNGSLRSAPTSLRLFVAATESGYRLLPGGIARLATDEGEISKDIWVPEGTMSEIPSGTPGLATARRSDRDLPSRTADDLFWLGRYLERCEGAVRAYRNLFTHVGDSGAEEQRETARTVMKLLVSLDMMNQARANQFLTRSTRVGEREWWSVLFDVDSTDGLLQILNNVQRVAMHVRERLSGDAWQMFLSLNATPQRSWRVASLTDAIELMDQLIVTISALNGQTQENMTRGYGWRMLDLGRRIERAQYGIQILREIVTRESYTPSQMYLLLDLSDSMITYRSRYKNLPVLENLLHLLLLDESNPRSVVYQIERLREHMSFMPLEQTSDQMSDSQRILLTAYHELTLADPEKLASVVSKAGNRTQLRRILSRLDTTLTDLSEIITATYFAHTDEPG
jgi:uncharacterized circularly permuted ATP-grasp superfamily protein/uncharacterized alpha-E superfamily protein